MKNRYVKRRSEASRRNSVTGRNAENERHGEDEREYTIARTRKIQKLSRDRRYEE